jgi:hypothetical protein
MSRSAVLLESDVLDELVAVTGSKTKAAAVRIAVDELLRREKLRRIQRAAGTLSFTESAEELRHGDHRTG